MESESSDNGMTQTITKKRKKLSKVKTQTFDENDLQKTLKSLRKQNQGDVQTTIREYEQVDKQGRTYTHIQSLQQNINILKLLFENIEVQSKPGSFPSNIKSLMNIEDRYGNTPLQLACVYPADDRGEDAIRCKSQCIEYLLKLGSNPNVQNTETGFTPLHWLARHGETANVQLLLDNGAVEYIPDFKGYLPLDYSGMFEHDEVTETLIYRMHKTVISANQSNNLIDGFTFLPDLFQILKTSMLQSTMLYWASDLPENGSFTADKLKSMFFDGNLKALAEINIYTANNKTAIHAAALSGNVNKLQILIESVKSRQPKDGKISLKIQGNSQNQFLDKLLKIKNLNKYAKNCIQFEKNQLLMQKKLLNQSWIDEIDEEGRSALHYSCQNNHAKCTEILMIQNGSSQDLCADSGLRPRDLIQHDDIRQVFRQYYQGVDNAMLHIDNDDLKELKANGCFEKTVQLNQTAMIPHVNNQVADKSSKNEKLKSQYEKECLQSLLQIHIKRKQGDWDLIHKALRHRQWLPEISYLALKLRVQHNQKNRMNNLISSLIKTKFIVRIFPAVEADDIHFMLLELSQKDLEEHAEDMKYPMKLMDDELKTPYDRNFKGKFEPFRSKDMQQISLQLIEETIQRDELMQLLICMFPMHNLYEINDIETKHEETSLYEFFSQNSIIPTLERKQEFNAINALKNYFGERQGFLYAFKNYYTSWLTIPAGLGILISLMSFYQNTWISLWSYGFAIFMSFWITLFIEYWKRKANKLRTVWGTIIDQQSSNQKVRFDYISNEEFSHSNFKVQNKDTKPYLAVFYKFASRLIMCSLIAITFTLFRVLEMYYTGIWSGVINGLISTATNMIFRQTIVFMNQKENHKFEEGYINSLIQKVFYFMFINTNITILATIYETENDYRKLYEYIFGMILQKLLKLSFDRTIRKQITFNINRKMYFKACAAKAQDQRRLHNLRIQMLKKQDQVKIEQANEIREKIEIFKHLNSKQPFEFKRLVTVFDGDKKRAAQRNQMSSASCIQFDQLLIDQVELNSRMQDIKNEFEIFDIAEDFIICSYATLYSFICPTISLLIFMSRLLVSRYERRAHFNYRMRQPILHLNGLGHWLNILESIGYITVILNVIFLYLFKDQFADIIRSKFDYILPLIFTSVIEENNLGIDLSYFASSISEQETTLANASKDQLKEIIQSSQQIIERQDAIFQFMIIILVGEHIIILVKILMDSLIGDISQQVQDKKLKIEQIIEDIDDELKNREQEITIEGLRNKINKQKKVFKTVMDQANDKYSMIVDAQQSFVKKNQALQNSDYVAHPQSSSRKSSARKSSVMSSRRQGSVQRSDSGTINQNIISARSGATDHVLDTIKISPSPDSRFKTPTQSRQQLSPLKIVPRFVKTKPSLTAFLEERFGTTLEFDLEQKLHVHLQIRMYRETFLMIERQLIQRRLIQVNTQSLTVLINCTECLEQRASIQCHDCQDDSFCQECFRLIHQPNSQHNFSNIISQSQQLDAQTSSILSKSKTSKQSQIKNWQKFEQFNFPLNVSNEQYGHLKLYFTMIKSLYVQMNNINDESLKIDIVKMLLDQNFNVLGAQNKKLIMQRFSEEQKSTVIGINDYEIEFHKSSNEINTLASVKRMKKIGKAEEVFNSEELLFLNRVAFCLLASDGANLQFVKFKDCLKVLQEGQFEAKISLIIEMMKYGRQEQQVVKIDDFNNFIMTSMPQHVNQRKNGLQVLQTLFKEGEIMINLLELKQKLVGSQGEVKDILNCVLQS